MVSSSAHYAVSQAIKKGLLRRGIFCEICGIDKTPCSHRKILPGGVDTLIVGHHWKGYDYPLDVWWICRACNTTLRNKHNGEFTIEQAKTFVKAKQGFRFGKCLECLLDDIRKTDTYEAYRQRAEQRTGITNDPMQDVIALWFAQIELQL